MRTRFPMTSTGYNLLHKELSGLKTQGRADVAKAISDARKHGDLSENAEYHAAKDRQRNVEDRIAYLEKRLTDAQVIDMKDPGDGRVVFGAYVTVSDAHNKEKSFRIVGEDEADLRKGLLSSASPLARELLGKKIGDVMEIRAPGGIQEYEVLGVSYH